MKSHEAHSVSLPHSQCQEEVASAALTSCKSKRGQTIAEDDDDNTGAESETVNNRGPVSDVTEHRVSPQLVTRKSWLAVRVLRPLRPGTWRQAAPGKKRRAETCLYMGGEFAGRGSALRWSCWEAVRDSWNKVCTELLEETRWVNRYTDLNWPTVEQHRLISASPFASLLCFFSLHLTVEKCLVSSCSS